jgi:GNAT superfamily N-acetyltransferase
MNSLHAFEFKDIKEDIQKQIGNLLYTQWKDIFNQSDINSESEVITKMLEIYKCFAFLDGISKCLIGIVCVKIDTPTVTFNTNYWICNFYVLERFRKKNIGTKILEFVEDYLYNNNVSIANLWCEKNIIEFYKKYNWNATPESYPGHIGSSIMIKMLSPIKHQVIYNNPNKNNTFNAIDNQQVIYATLN